MEEEVKETETQGEEAKELEKPLEKMTAPELREIAKQIPGVEGVHAMKKEQLLEVIKKHRGIDDKTPKKVEKATVKELKKKIALFKAEKEEARRANDKRRIEILKRRINRLKKQTRKLARA